MVSRYLSAFVAQTPFQCGQLPDVRESKGRDKFYPFAFCKGHFGH